MLFNSFEFLAFFFATYSLYCLLRQHHTGQNVLLLFASYVFYACWDWRFLSLIVLSTFVDYVIARNISTATKPQYRKQLLLVSLATNLGMLGFFKYADFFIDSLTELLNVLGIQLSHTDLNIVLPVGISFYTFQTLSYTIDVYRGRQAIARPLDFALFVAFFPQLIAGPIERASRLLGQIAQPRHTTLGQIHTGVFLVVWGLFKKTVIADNLAVVADPIFANYADHTGATLLVAAIAFTVQIYCDFSGYSDIARGISKFMGFELMINFRLPYFAQSPSEFWSRWHISLSQWLRDYLYIPLGGNRHTRSRTCRNLLITMLLGGLWHGASWNFILWGAYHGLILIIYRSIQGSTQRQHPYTNNSLAIITKTVLMFGLTLFGWILFRCTNTDQLMHFLAHMGLGLTSTTSSVAAQVATYTAPLVAVQLAQHHTRDLDIWRRFPLAVQAVLLSALLCALFILGVRDTTEFIYFQF